MWLVVDPLLTHGSSPTNRMAFKLANGDRLVVSWRLLGSHHAASAAVDVIQSLLELLLIDSRTEHVELGHLPVVPLLLLDQLLNWEVLPLSIGIAHELVELGLDHRLRLLDVQYLLGHAVLPLIAQFLNLEECVVV